jgi:hypothetical protein
MARVPLNAVVLSVFPRRRSVGARAAASNIPPAPTESVELFVMELSRAERKRPGIHRGISVLFAPLNVMCHTHLNNEPEPLRTPE